MFEISAASHTGVKELINAVAAKLATLPPVTIFEPEYVEPELKPDSADDLNISLYDDVWVIEGAWMERLVRNINFSDYESRMFFDKSLRQAGLYDRLEEHGIKDGDTISIYNIEFEYHK